MEVDPPAQLAVLQGHIQTVSQLRERLQATRQIPLQLLRPFPTAGMSDNVSPQHRILHDFQRLKELKAALCADTVQTAMRAAQESERADKTEIHWAGRRQNLKRRRSPLPESPKPYVPPPQESHTVFPEREEEEEEMPLRMDGLPEYIRQFNRTHGSKLHIWSRTRTRSPALMRPTPPVVVRFLVPDVLVVFLTLGEDRESPGAIVIETVAAFGPRERKAPHAYSDYAAYQDLSQQLAYMIRSQPRVSLPSFVDLLCSYEGIFVDHCTSCQRVLAIETHVPPVARLWVGPGKDGEEGKWHPRHVACQRQWES